jgi:hypothetical protein
MYGTGQLDATIFPGDIPSKDPTAINYYHGAIASGNGISADVSNAVDFDGSFHS